MKLFKYLFLATFSFAACQSEPSKNVTAPEKEETMDSEKTLVVPWNVQIGDSTNALEIRRDPAADMTNLEPSDIVDALNLKYPEIKLQWVKLDGEKALVSIADATYLTQQTGSEGAQAYLAEATYSLTELKGITAVEFDFEEGDHARPGVYKRTDFKF
ncbi:hypothetical protein [Daejeonella lutea]|uniref:Uncharacterized protein n=1 Tax=Daejeonella lutea TaxID=572036 RepID=A0A1T4ZYQ5_9SPHI|nr:hypothetical protein [Daejeonella lutea]SKB27619.1 hypothetical protein SAMN05661099_0067 [Daejeonella lutea]